MAVHPNRSGSNMREWVIFVLSCVALAGGIIAALATAGARDFQLRGYVDPIEDSNLPYRVPRLGVNASLEQYIPHELDEQLALMTAANIVWVRQEISWAVVEAEQDNFDWSRYDAIITALAQYPNLRPILVLRDAPPWARDEQAKNHPTAPPTEIEAFAMFVEAVAARYGNTVDHYQIWDEPNLRDAWGGLDPRPANYAAILSLAYTTIHSTDPHAVVIMAALAPTTETGPHNLNEWVFLEQLYQLGVSDSFDAVGAKPYGFDTAPNDRSVRLDTLNVSRIVRLREIMVEYGDGHKAIWASNWGWNSLPDSWSGKPSIWGEVEPDTRNRYTLEMLTRAEREWPWLAGMTLQHWQPIAPNDDPIWGFALVWQDGQPTSLLTDLAEQAIPTRAATNGLYPADTPHATYQGVWTFGDLGADIGWLNDSRFMFRFSGERVGLVVREGDYVAYLYPKVNDAAPSLLPRDKQGNAYIVLTSPRRTPSLTTIPIADELNDGTHTLTATADRGWDRWVLAGYVVSDRNLTTPYQRQTMLAWFTSALATVAVVVSARQIAWRSVFTPLYKLGHSLRWGVNFTLGLLTSVVLLAAMMLMWGWGEASLLRRDSVSLGLSLLSAGLLYVNPALVLAAVAALVLFWLFYHRVEIGLLLTLMWSPFFLFPVQLYLYVFPMAELLLLITIGAWVLRGMVHVAKRYRAGRVPLPSISLSAMDYGMAAFTLSALLTLTWTTYMDPAITELRVMIVEPLLFYAMLRTKIQDQTKLRWFADGLLVSGIVVAGIGLGMYAFGAGIITAEGGARRLAGVYGSPNNTALWMGRTMPMALAYLLLVPGRYRRGLGLSLMLVGGTALALTQSAGGLFIGVPVALAVVLILVLQRRAILPLAGLVLVGGIGGIYLLRFPRFAQLLDFTSGTNFFRLRVWESAINVICDYPITGLGLDQFLYFFRGTYILPDAWQEPDLSHPHNFLLDFWTRLGLAGVFVFAWLQVAFWGRVRLLYGIVRENKRHFAVLVGIVGAMANLLAHGLVDNSVFVNDLALLFVFLLAAVQVSTVAETPNHEALNSAAD
jgi:O-antigen ligase